ASARRQGQSGFRGVDSSAAAACRKVTGADQKMKEWLHALVVAERQSRSSQKCIHIAAESARKISESIKSGITDNSEAWIEIEAAGSAGAVHIEGGAIVSSVSAHVRIGSRDLVSGGCFVAVLRSRGAAKKA